MTTLHVRTDQLRSVVEPYPVVKDLRVSSDFPHGLKITIIENTPVAAVVAGGEKTPVAGDGRLLRGADERQLPTVPVSVPFPAAITSSIRSHARPSSRWRRRRRRCATVSCARPRPSTAASRSSSKTVRTSASAVPIGLPPSGPRPPPSWPTRARPAPPTSISATPSGLPPGDWKTPPCSAIRRPSTRPNRLKRPRRRCRRRAPRHSQPQPQLEPTERRKSQGQLQTSANCKQDCALDLALTPKNADAYGASVGSGAQAPGTLDAT